MKGISLLELVITMAIGAFVVTISATVFSDVTKDFNRSQRLSVLVGTAPSIQKSLSNYFSRALGAALTSKSIPPAGYSIQSEGGIYIVADLRKCPAFDPGTSNIVANQTEILVMCCSPKLSLTLNAPSPPLAAGGTLAATSACTNSFGLSIQERQGGAITSSLCFQDIHTMDAFTVGFHQLRQTPLYQFDFLGNTGRTSKGEAIGKFNFRFGAFAAPGNMGPLTVKCQ